MSFLRSPTNTSRFGRAALVALHGSWNRTALDGYKLVLLQWDEAGKIRQSDFLTGFISDVAVRGRPVDVVEAPDGSLFVSDDYANTVYRIGPVGPVGTVGTTVSGSQATKAVVKRTAQQALIGVTDAEKAAAVKRSSELMQQHACAACHVSGSPLAAKWPTLAERYTLDELAGFFLAPTPPMPVFALTLDDRRALAIGLLAGPVKP